MLRKLLIGVAAAAIGLSMASAASAKDKITLLTWNLPVYGDKINGWIKEFHQKYPDIDVEWIDKKGTDWATFYQTQLAAGTPPDVIDVQGALWAQYAADGQLLDLTPYLKKDPDFANRFTPGALDLWKTDGKTWMVPWYFTRTLLYLNKKMTKAAGITKPPSSFDELIADADKMKGEGKSGFLTTNFDWLYWPLFRMNGVHILNKDMTRAAFNTPAAVKTLKTLADATKSGAINSISWTGRWVEPNTAFASGNVGMYLSLNSALFWAASKADWINAKNVEVVNAPGGWWVPSQHGFGVSKASKHPDAAVDLIKIATSDKWQTTMANTFSILTLNKDVDQKLIEKLKTEDPLKAKVLELSKPDAATLTGYLKTPKEARVKEAFWGAVQPALLGQTDPKAALDSAETAVNRALARP